jgi:hypothetical protein
MWQLGQPPESNIAFPLPRSDACGASAVTETIAGLVKAEKAAAPKTTSTNTTTMSFRILGVLEQTRRMRSLRQHRSPKGCHEVEVYSRLDSYEVRLR